MARELVFKHLPFVPVEGQVIYVEPSYNKRLNGFIRDNYDWLKKTFHSHGLDFCYLPLLAEETISYNAPYLTDQDCKDKAQQVPSLAEFIDDDPLGSPVLVFGHDWSTEDDDGHVVLQSLPIKTKFLISSKTTFRRLAKEIQRLASSQCFAHRRGESYKTSVQEKDNGSEIRFSIDSRPKHDEEDQTETDSQIRIKEEESGAQIRFSIGPSQDEAEEHFDSESQRLIEEIKTRINSLRNRGVNTMFLHDIIDEGEHISRLRVTKDFRIFLVDYDNMEIKMPVLPKSVFMLFLRHPEGIRFKELSDYYSELLDIYQKMHPIGGRDKQEQSIRDVTDPCSNSINEKCARIREAFVTNFDDRLARNYYVTGKRGEPKRIILDKAMILWEN